MLGGTDAPRDFGGGDDLILCVVGQQVAGNLFDDELIIGLVLIERIDDPVTVEPDLAGFALLEQNRGVRPARSAPDRTGVTSGVRSPDGGPGCRFRGGPRRRLSCGIAVQPLKLAFAEPQPTP